MENTTLSTNNINKINNINNTNNRDNTNNKDNKNNSKQGGNIIIRKETPEDYRKTEYMVMRAFWNIHVPGCNEHLLVSKLRNSPDYLPEFS